MFFKPTLFAAAAALAAAAMPAAALTLEQTTVNGLAVYRTTWTDSAGLSRSVSLKKQGAGNAGNGGYAVQMTYQRSGSGTPQTVVINPTDPGDGFGYFVSHERYRTFVSGADNTIAARIFGKDGSPLGKNFPVRARVLSQTPSKAAIRFALDYPRYGTVAATGFNANTGKDSPPLGLDPSLYALYQLHVAIVWRFEDGKDFPRIETSVDMRDVPGPDRVSFDLRGPYGKMNFDAGGAAISAVTWGDRFHFRTTTSPLTRNSSWTWNTPNNTARYVGLIAGAGEMGLVEPRPIGKTATADGYADARGETSATFNNGNGCPAQAQTLPCDWEWAYQSSQYELPYNNRTGTTTSEKFAWGSSPYYGKSSTSVWDGTSSQPIRAFPANATIAYALCLVYGDTVAGGLAKSVAAGGGSYRCAVK